MLLYNIFIIINTNNQYQYTLDINNDNNDDINDNNDDINNLRQLQYKCPKYVAADTIT